MNFLKKLTAPKFFRCNIFIVLFYFSTNIFAIDFVCSKNINDSVFCKQQIIINKNKFKIQIELTKLNTPEFPYKGYVVWGLTTSPSNKYMKVLSVTLNKEKSWIPLSIFSDLRNVKKIQVIENDEGFKINIIGGSASTAYKADIYFDKDGYVTKRNVNSLSFPDQLYMVSTYSFIK